jgi:hypothetical protein
MVKSRMGRGARERLLVACLVAFGAVLPFPAVADSLADAVKAAFLYKFASFVDWPTPVSDGAAASFDICVVGDDSLEGLLRRAVSGEQIAGHPFALRHLDVATRDSGCEIMFIKGSAAQSVAQVLAVVEGSPVLTVTDRAEGQSPVGIINFVIRQNRVRFEIDQTAAESSGLKISSKLLSLAVPAKETG